MDKPRIEKNMPRAFHEILKDIPPTRGNCVLFARTKVPQLPFGLFTIEDKKKIINAKKPKIGSVAIIRTREKWGHVGVVIYAKGRHISILEANYWPSRISIRHDTPANLNIIGYYQPPTLDKK